MDRTIDIFPTRVKIISPGKLKEFLIYPTYEDVINTLKLSGEIVTTVGFVSLLFMILYYIL